MVPSGCKNRGTLPPATQRTSIPEDASLSASSPGLCRMGEAVWFHGASPTLRLVTEARKDRHKDRVMTFTGELIVRAHWPPWEATECLCAPVGQIIRVLNRAEKEEIEDEFIGE